mgnify:CR=1 FL=1
MHEEILFYLDISDLHRHIRRSRKQIFGCFSGVRGEGIEETTSFSRNRSKSMCDVFFFEVFVAEFALCVFAFDSLSTFVAGLVSFKPGILSFTTPRTSSTLSWIVLVSSFTCIQHAIIIYGDDHEHKLECVSSLTTLIYFSTKPTNV